MTQFDDKQDSTTSEQLPRSKYREASPISSGFVPDTTYKATSLPTVTTNAEEGFVVARFTPRKMSSRRESTTSN